MALLIKHLPYKHEGNTHTTYIKAGWAQRPSCNLKDGEVETESAEQGGLWQASDSVKESASINKQRIIKEDTQCHCLAFTNIHKYVLHICVHTHVHYCLP